MSLNISPKTRTALRKIGYEPSDYNQGITKAQKFQIIEAAAKTNIGINFDELHNALTTLRTYHDTDGNADLTNARLNKLHDPQGNLHMQAQMSDGENVNIDTHIAQQNRMQSIKQDITTKYQKEQTLKQSQQVHEPVPTKDRNLNNFEPTDSGIQQGVGLFR